MKVWCAAILTAVLAAVVSVSMAGEWQQVHPETESSYLVDVCHDGGQWAAVASDGTVLESADGLDWVMTGSAGVSSLSGVVRIAVGGGALVVARDGGLASVRTPAGTWTHVIPTGVRHVGDLRWDGERFIIFGDDAPTSPSPIAPPENALIATSPDGVDWTVRATIPDGSTPGLSRVASGGGIRVAVGTMLGVYGSTGEVDFATVVSGDGEEWEVETGQPNLQLAAWDGSRFVAVDAGGALIGARGPVLTSVDGRSWEASGLETGLNLHDLSCGIGRCLGVASSSLVEIDLAAGSVVETPGPPGLRLQACSCFGERCVVVGEEGTILVTEVAGAWHVVQSGREPDLAAVAEHGGTWVAVGSPRLPSTSVLYSRDGRTWSPARVEEPTGALADVAWAGDAFAAVAENGLILESGSGEAWLRAGSPTSEPLRAVAGDGRGAVAIGGQRRGVMLRRDVGGGWHELPLALPPLHDVVWDGRRYLAAGDGGTLLESPDGREWTAVGGLRPTDLRWVASNGYRMLIGGEWGTLTSVDGVDWVPSALESATGIVWTGRGFMSTMTSPQWSADGLTWGSSGSWASLLKSAHSAAGATVAVGAYGQIIRRQGPASAAAAAPWKALIPVLASTDGRSGTTWRSELRVQKPLHPSAPTTPTAFFLSGSGGGGTPVARDLPVERYGHYQDPVAELFARPGAVGALLLAADRPHLLAASVVGSSDAGRYRQLVPTAAIDEDRAPRLLPLLGATATTRVNLALVNPHDRPVDALVEVVADDGTVRGRQLVFLGPWSSLLVTDVVRRATGGEAVIEPLLRVVPFDDRPAPVAMASIVDAATGDPITVTAAAVTDEALAVPVVAHNPGVGASLWRSDLMLHNPGPSAARLRLELHPLDDWRVVHRTPWLQLAAGASVRYHDVVESVFGQGGTGWLRVALGSGRLAGVSRTYDVAAPSPLGHPVPAVDEGSVLRHATTWAGGLRVSRAPERRTRTRIGAVNLDDRTQVVAFSVYRADDGVRLTTLQFAVRPRNQTFRELIPDRDWFPEGQSEISLVLEAVPGTRGPRLLVFGSTVDAATGDAQLVVATPPP